MRNEKQGEDWISFSRAYLDTSSSNGPSAYPGVSSLDHQYRLDKQLPVDVCLRRNSIPVLQSRHSPDLPCVDIFRPLLQGSSQKPLYDLEDGRPRSIEMYESTIWNHTLR